MRVMSFRPLAILPLVLVSVLIAASVAAECVRVSAKNVLENPDYELVFAGTVVNVTRTAELGYRATFDVDRVWRGSVTRRFDLYVWELAPEIPRFEVGKRYLALAKHLTDPRARQGVGLGNTDRDVFTPAQCGDPLSLAPNILGELGVGQPPRN
jgi:hypothetical protein